MKKMLLLIIILLPGIPGSAMAEPPFLFPTEARWFTVPLIHRFFYLDEWAAEKQLEGRLIGIGGTARGVKEAPYFSNPKGKSVEQGRFTRIRLGLIFVGYLTGDPVAIPEEGDLVMLLCWNVRAAPIGVQAECRVADYGPKGEDGRMHSVFKQAEE